MNANVGILGPAMQAAIVNDRADVVDFLLLMKEVKLYRKAAHMGVL